MGYAIKQGALWVEIHGAFVSGDGADAVQHPADWLACSTAVERAAIGVVEIVSQPPPLAEIQQNRSITSELIDIEGVPHKVFTLHPFTSEEAAERRWEEAKAYRAQRQTMPLPIPGIIPGDTIIADCDQGSRDMVNELVQGATVALIMQAPFELSFTAYDNRSFTVNAQQTIAIGTAITKHRALCHGASQAIRDLLQSAVESGATAAEIFEIDITAGYPPIGGEA